MGKQFDSRAQTRRIPSHTLAIFGNGKVIEIAKLKAEMTRPLQCNAMIIQGSSGSSTHFQSPVAWTVGIHAIRCTPVEGCCIDCGGVQVISSYSQSISRYGRNSINKYSVHRRN